MSEFPIPDYQWDFTEATQQIARIVQDWAMGGELGSPNWDDIQDCVSVKYASRVIAHTNPAYRAFFSRYEAIDGVGSEAFIDSTTVSVSQKTDELLLASSQSVDVEHVALGPDGASYHVRTHKRWLSPNSKHLAILCVTRVLSRIDATLSHRSERLASLAQNFLKLSPEDQRLCQMLATGITNREIAEELRCTARTIENRRNRILDVCGLSKPIDIVKMVVRLSENGVISEDF